MSGKGTRYTLTEYRIAVLDAIGFNWNVGVKRAFDSHRSSHQSVWSTNQILVQPARWHLQQISYLPSHSNELTLVGMRSMVTTEIATDETWSLPNSKYPSYSKDIYVPSQERENNQQSSQKTILWHTMCREHDRSEVTIIHWESRTRSLPTSTCKTNADYMLQQQQEERTTIHYK
jgi:hypothetical protein